MFQKFRGAISISLMGLEKWMQENETLKRSNFLPMGAGLRTLSTSEDDAAEEEELDAHRSLEREESMVWMARCLDGEEKSLNKDKKCQFCLSDSEFNSTDWPFSQLFTIKVHSKCCMLTDTLPLSVPPELFLSPENAWIGSESHGLKCTCVRLVNANKANRIVLTQFLKLA